MVRVPFVPESCSSTHRGHQVQHRGCGVSCLVVVPRVSHRVGCWQPKDLHSLHHHCPCVASTGLLEILPAHWFRLHHSMACPIGHQGMEADYRRAWMRSGMGGQAVAAFSVPNSRSLPEVKSTPRSITFWP